MANFTPKNKPSKPYAEFPLCAHPNGQWVKKICGKLYYFGTWDDPGAALEDFNRNHQRIREGLPRITDDVDGDPRLHQICNAFMEAKEAAYDMGELSARSYRDYLKTCKSLAGYFGRERQAASIQLSEFLEYRKFLSKRLGPVSLGNEINRIRIVFRYASENKIIFTPILFGSEFKRPSRKVLRQSRYEAGKKLFTCEEVHKILNHLESKTDIVMRAMVLLGLNCGFGSCGGSGLADCWRDDFYAAAAGAFSASWVSGER